MSLPPRAKREAKNVMMNLSPRAKREAAEVLMNLPPRVEREAKGYWSTYNLLENVLTVLKEVT